MSIPVLETERLLIRPFTMDDLPDIQQVYSDAGWVDANTSIEAQISERRSWLEWTVRNYGALANLYQPPYGDRAIELKQTGAMIGAVGLVPGLAPFGLLPYYQNLGGEYANGNTMRNFPEVGLFWALKRGYQGSGYATEAARALSDFAFRNLYLRRILAWTDYENEDSMAVMRRLGMTIERNPGSEPEWFQIVGILEYAQETQIEHSEPAASASHE
ncbi:MAG: GNAT family N-acetyltransferase [Anaerolineae bacterium]|nr:GNAT family N-acetyltransferase [Anaerolineae bacterium]